jgi:transcriptional regulator of acetoin/glycerol metabolism
MSRDETRLPVLSSRQRDHVRRSRETLVGGGILEIPPGGTGVAQVIESSWRRCVGERVPVAPERIDYREPDDDLPALRRAAGPVLDRLRHSLADVAVALVLSDASGRILARHADVRRQRTLMDRASAAEGFDFSEPSIGTNGIGTVLVERRPLLVRGPEHYNAGLEDLTCAGTPIIEPYTGRVVGSFSLACSTRDVHPLMAVLAGDVGRQIEAGLLDQAGERHRRLVDAYLAIDHARAGALVVDEDTVLANRPGLAHIGPDLHPLLWRYLCEHRQKHPHQMQVPLSDGFHDALVEPIHEAGKPAFSLRLLPRRPDPPGVGGPVTASPASVSPASVSLPAREPLHHDPEVVRQLEDARRHGEVVAVVGPSGAGKLRTAERLLRREGLADPLIVEPHLDPEWFVRARDAVTARRGLIIRRVHETPHPSVGQVQSLLAAGVPAVLTADLDAADDAVTGLVRRLATTVRLPALAQHREHLPSLVRAVVAELPAPASRTRFSSAAWERLLAWHWPGNLAELHTAVVGIARRAAGGLVEEGDLPEELRGPRRALGLMESAERVAVAEALRTSHGNRTLAARALGIGRNTLYRKMREFGLE